MSPARTNDHGIDLNKLVHHIVLDIALLRWSAVTGGRGLAAISALVAERREGDTHGGRVLDFLERHIAE